MSQDLASSVPGVFAALLKLIRAAAVAQEQPVAVFPFAVGQYEPGSYIMIAEIKGPRYEWESIGSFAQKEFYDICGKTTVFSGDSPATNENLAVEVMEQTFALFQACVMTPVMSNRDMPLLGTEGPSPYLVLPTEANYEPSVGTIGGGPAGWDGVLDWGFHFEALLTPA